MATWTVTCKACKAKLKLKDSKLAGRKVRCPKCQETVRVPAMKGSQPSRSESRTASAANSKTTKTSRDAGWDEEFEDFDDFEDWTDDSAGSVDLFASATKPSRKREKQPSESTRKAKRSKSSRKQKTSPGRDDDALPRGLIIGISLGGIFLLAVVCTAVVLLIPAIRGDGPRDRFAWVPNDTATYVKVNVSEIWNSPGLKPLRTSIFADQTKSILGERGDLKIEDVESVVLAYPDQSREPVMILRATRPIDPFTVEGASGSSKYAGRTLHQSAIGAQSSIQIDEQTLVIGPTLVLQALIDRTETTAVAEKFSSLPSKGDIIFATSASQYFSNGFPLAQIAGNSSEIEDLGNYHGVINIDNDLEVEYTTSFADATAAKSVHENLEAEAKKQLEELIEQKAKLDEMNFVLTRQDRANNVKMQEILKSVRYAQNKNTITTSLKMPSSIFEDIIKGFEALGPGAFSL